MANGDERARDREEDIRQQELDLTSRRLTLALCAGFGLVAARFVFPWFACGVGGGNWVISGIGLVAMLWAGAWFAGGFMLGFLFGIPKTVQNTNSSASTASPAEPRFRVNTNLEEISDWLTKVLVGATLTQLVKAPGALQHVASYMARSAGSPQHESLFAAVVLYFATVGFFAGYVLTRMFFSGAFGRSDHAISSTDVTVMRNVPLVPGDDALPNPVSENVKNVARNLRDVKLSDRLSAGEAIAVARGASVTGDTDRALKAASFAIQKAPRDPHVYIEHARALQKSGAHSHVILDELEKARGLIQRSTAKGDREELYNALVFLALYQDPPAGFGKAIEWAKEFLENNVPTQSSILTNLASAYGQHYEYAKKTQLGPEVLNGIMDEAKRAIERAIAINPEAINRLRQLADGTGGIDRDLVSLATDSPAIRELLGINRAPPA
jgi:tetratricopeptide (TPR) repeat protein